MAAEDWLDDLMCNASDTIRIRRPPVFGTPPKPPERWYTADGRILNIKDMDADHARAALAMVMHNVRMGKRAYIDDAGRIAFQILPRYEPS